MSPFKKESLHMPSRPRATPALPTPSTFNFPTGDVTVLLSNVSDPDTPTRALASTSSLSIASPVWKKFLCPPWATDSTTPATSLDFTSDPLFAITLLLQVAHLKFRNIPSKLPYRQLLQVAILCDQYSCASLVAPWLDSWLSDEKTASKEDGKEGWLFIAWAFGREFVFVELAKKLVLEVKIGKKGECLTKNGEAMPEPIPNEILESILKIRAKTIEQLFRIPFTWLTNFEQSTKPLCLRNYDKEACDAMIYGSVARGIQKASLWPLTTSGNITLSIEELANVLKGIKIQILPEPRGKSVEWSHINCKTLNMHFGVAKILDSVGNPVLDCHRLHMREQRGEVKDK